MAVLKDKTEQILKKIIITKKAAFYLVPTIILVGTLVLIALTAAFYHFYYWGKIYPGVKVAGIYVGGLNTDKATEKLRGNISAPEKLVLKSHEQQFEIAADAIDFSYDHEASAKNAFYVYKSSNTPQEFIKSFFTLKEQPDFDLEFNLNEEKLDEVLSVIAGQVAIEPQYPQASVVNGVIAINKGKKGQDIEINKVRNNIHSAFSKYQFTPITIDLKDVDKSLDDSQAIEFQERAERFLGKSLSLKFEYTSLNYKANDLVRLLDAHGTYIYDELDILIDKAVAAIKREPQNAVFKFEDGKVQEFLPAKDGIVADKGQLKKMFIENLEELEHGDTKIATVDIPTIKTPPKVTTQEVNGLGINELIGKGESWYAGSISSRIHNIGLAASKFNGVLIAPGETFSFNEIVGDVSALTGYKQAYVIMDGKTVLGDGGGVCQVSTTLFRAVLNAGLPIVERRAHSYRVTYYEQNTSPGLDATVYAPTTDLKIKNDTPKHILIQTINDPKNVHLVFEIYGTSDGRIATITKPVVTAVIPPPEDLYIDDPNLPDGTVKQIDWKAWGAKVVFDYRVERGGEVLIDKTYASNYRAWQAKFLRGTAPVN